MQNFFDRIAALQPMSARALPLQSSSAKAIAHSDSGVEKLRAVT